YLAVELVQTSIDDPDLRADASSLENAQLRIAFSDDGLIRSIFDKANQREVMAASGNGNCLTVYVDSGDAWDFPFDYREKATAGLEVRRDQGYIEGPRAIMRQKWRYGESFLSQQIILTAGSRRVDFVTEVDWHERGKMLRTAFPFAIQAATATRDI